MLRAVVTLAISVLVLLFCGWVIPGFVVFGFWGAVKTAVVIALLGYVAQKLSGRRMSTGRKGFFSFVFGAVIIYVSQYLIPNSVDASLVGALVASLVIGVVDGIVPLSLR